MNIFEKFESVNEELKNKTESFVYTAHKVINDINPNSEKLHGFITGYHGFSANASQYTKIEYIENPNYNPNLSNEEHRKPENLKLQTGFSTISVETEMVSIVATEIQDVWDDGISPEESWRLDVPLELFLNGSESDIYDYFKKSWENELISEKDNQIQNHWQGLLNYSLDELQTYLDVAKENNLNGYLSYSQFLIMFRQIKELSK